MLVSIILEIVISGTPVRKPCDNPGAEFAYAGGRRSLWQAGG
jgi:hypothetical protein